MKFVTIVNRSSKTLEGTWDGKHYEIPPGKSSFPEIQADAFRRQNPIMGTEDPLTLERQYLIGIVECGHDCSPIEQSDALTMAKVDMSKYDVIKGNGLYRPMVDGSKPLPSDSNFVKP